MSTENLIKPYQVKHHPTLSAWVSTLEEKVDNVLMDYLTTSYDQSNVFYGKLFSFHYTLAEHGHNPSLCAEHVNSDLNTLFSRYFKRAEIFVEHFEEEEGSNKYNLFIRVGVSDGQGDRYEGQRKIDIENSRVSQYAHINNEGHLYGVQRFVDYQIL